MALHLRGTGSIQWQETTYNSTGMDLYQEQQGERREDAVEKLQDDFCRLTTKLQTTYRGSQGAFGSMFSILANETLEILTFEFDYSRGASDFDVQVYYRKGGFLEVANNADEWTQIADTAALTAPDDIGAIIPTNDVDPVTVDAGELYSFYLAFKTDKTLSLGPSRLQPGAPWQKDDLLQVQVGVGLESGPFPGEAGVPSTFRGTVHYKTVTKCVDARTTTSVTLDFAVAADPTEEAIEQLNEAIGSAVTALLVLDPNYIRYKKFHDLEVVKVISGFQGRTGKWNWFSLP
jgi:hypothetical protein